MSDLPDRAGQPQRVALLTGGADKPYALGLAASLIAQGVPFDFIGSDEINGPDLHGNALVNFLNLRGDQSTKASAAKKMSRVLSYYWRLLGYAATAKPKVFHILWNNKFEHFDRTILPLYYRLLGKRLVFTAHNVNIRRRDGKDSWFNRLTLGIQYRLIHHIFVHTEQMQRELQDQFGVPTAKISVIPFGINSTVPNTSLTLAQARQRFGLKLEDKVVLFFGNIAPYKGLEFLTDAMIRLMPQDASLRLIVAGNPKNCADYWADVQKRLASRELQGRVIERIEFVPDEETEVFFKAADVLILPYTHIFQSGVLFLGYNFGLPVIASDVGSLRADIVEGETGYICKPKDAIDLAAVIHTYFSSDLFKNLKEKRAKIQDYANERYSWTKVVQITRKAYDA